MHKVPSREVFAVHCSSAVYQPYFQEFLRRDLRLDHYALLALPGGVQSLAAASNLPKFAWAGWRWIKFLVDLDSPSRIILIGHDDCRWYQSGPIPHAIEPERKRQEADLRRTALQWRERFPDCDVSIYFAALTAGKAAFDAVR